MKLYEIEKYLSEKLELNQYSSMDSSLNGIQVGDLNREIKKVVLAVDASLETFKQAKANGADLIIVHHGLFWGKPLAIKGSHFKRVEFLIKNNIALFACHLPLDAHLELGNNAGIAKKIGLECVEPFSKYKGVTIGVKGRLKKATGLDDIKRSLLGDNEPAFVVPGGKNLVETVGIVSGGAPFSVYDAINEGLDLFITGDKSHEVYHSCYEEGINMISAGHYATEIFGVKAIGNLLEKEFQIETTFIDIPTGA